MRPCLFVLFCLFVCLIACLLASLCAGTGDGGLQSQPKMPLHFVCDCDPSQDRNCRRSNYHSNKFVAWLPWNVYLSSQHRSSRQVGLHGKSAAVQLPEVSSLASPNQSDEGRPRVWHFSQALTCCQALWKLRWKQLHYEHQRLVQGGF